MDYNRILETTFTAGKLAAFELSASVMLDLLSVLCKDDVLVSPTTGECICRDELSRVAGILSGLANNNKWDITK